MKGVKDRDAKRFSKSTNFTILCLRVGRKNRQRHIFLEADNEHFYGKFSAATYL